MRDYKSVSDRIVDYLVKSGINTFFGIPGGPVSPVFDSILRNASAHLIESRHETTAAFAAASYYEDTGKVAAVIVTAGPGGTNAITGITSAYLKRIPMVVICGDVAWSQTGERLIQDCGPQGIDIESIFSSVTRGTIRINQSQSACSHVAHAVEKCKDELYPGPVLVVLPLQVANEPSYEQPPIAHEVIAKPTSLPFKAVFKAVIDLLENAQKPLLVVGNGCRWISKELEQLIAVTGIPFVTTPQAKGILSENHPLSLRNGGLAASWWARRYVNTGDEIDVCMALGTDLDDCATGPTKYIRKTTKLIHVDIDSMVFNRNYSATLPVKTDLTFFINELLLILKDQSIKNPKWGDCIAEIKMESPFDKANYAEDQSTIVAPHRVISDIQKAMPRNTRYITDIGEHMLFALHYLTIDQPRHFQIHLNLGSMGSGVGGALGLGVSNPEGPVVCICGDGSMQMVGMEVLVAKQMNLPIVFAIFNDGRYNMVYHGFKTMYGYEHPWNMPFVDFEAWAKAMGINAVTIKHPGEFTQELVSSLSQQGPLVLDIRIDKNIRIAGSGRDEHLQHMSVSNILQKKV